MLDDKSVIFVGNRSQANQDIFIGKTDSVGTLLWIKNYGGAEYDAVYHILEHSSGGYVIGGGTQGLDGVMGPMIIKTNADGDVQWTHVYGNGMPAGSVAEGLVQLSNNSLAISGTIMPDQGTALGMIAQVNSDGEGCNYTSVALPSVTETTNIDMPGPWAGTGPTATVSFVPILNEVTLADSIDCSNLSTGEEITGNEITLYPNPVEMGNEFWISYSNIINETMKVEVFDCTGQVVFADIVSQNMVGVPTEGWSRGLYVVAIEVGQYREMSRVLVR